MPNPHPNPTRARAPQQVLEISACAVSRTPKRKVPEARRVHPKNKLGKTFSLSGINRENWRKARFSSGIYRVVLLVLEERAVYAVLQQQARYVVPFSQSSHNIAGFSFVT
jgi:hypothetical protein